MKVLRLWAQMPRRGIAIAGVMAGAATVLASVALMATSGYLIARTAERPPILDLMIIFVAVRFFGLARPALRYVERLVSHDVTFRLLQRVRRWFVDALLPLAPARLADFRPGDLLATLAGDVERLRDVHLRVVAPALVGIIISACVTAAVSRVDGRLALVVLGLLAANGVVWPLLTRQWTRGIGPARNRERAAMSAQMVPLLQGVADVLAFGRERDELMMLQQHQRQLDALQRREAIAAAAHAGAASLASQMSLWYALWLLVPAVAAGWLSGPSATLLALGIVAAFEAVDGLPGAWLAYEQLDDAVTRVRNVLASTPAVTDPQSSATLPFNEMPRSAERSTPAIRFSGVRLAHAGTDVLQDVSLQVAEGEHVAIVGPSGAGKSTLLSLVARVWDPTEGDLSIRGVDARLVPLARLRAAMTTMPQQIHVFDDTLRENVRLARPTASDDEILRALKQAQFEPVLAALPHGLDSRVGEHGGRLSAGERQRLGLARLMLSNAPLVLVDEPTADLDTITEHEVLQALERWSRGRTLLLVTHRLVDLAAFDRVLVMNRGRVVEDGPYDDLIGRHGLLTQLVDAQHSRLCA